MASLTFNDIPDYIGRFLSYLSVFENKSDYTIIEYHSTLREYLQFLTALNSGNQLPDTKEQLKTIDVTDISITQLAAVTTAQINEYLVFISKVLRNSNSTISKKLTALRCYYRYLCANAGELEIQFPTGDPTLNVLTPEVVNNPVEIITVQNMERLLSAISGVTACRDRAIILFLATTGVSLSELVGINTRDVDLKNATVAIQKSKNPRKVILTPPCKRQFRELQKEYESQLENFLDSAFFLNIETLKRLTARSVQLRLTKTAGVAGLPSSSVSPQILRNSVAKILAESCGVGGEQQICRYLGYRSTAKYDWLSNASQADLIFIDAILRRSPLYTLGDKI